MPLRIYNTAKREKEVFVPEDPENVRMYACGPTVYDFAHIGNGRTFVAFDQLFRVLREVFGPDHVTYARNITDVDDKINAAAKEQGVPIEEITRETTRAFHEDLATLNCLAPTVEPRATEYISQMQTMIEKLIAKRHAYAAEGHVLFAVDSMADYGKLSGRSIDDMIAGARVEVAPFKRNPMDFVLWKPSTDDMPGWESPWGRGRPGWHMECSAMSETLFGDTFDIHGGGADLVFPHHENEIAQSTCAHAGAPMARYWVHSGYLQVEGTKMSKSLGNFHTVHDLARAWPGEALRLQFLMTHYRQPLNWSEGSLREAKTVLDRWYRATESVGDVSGEPLPDMFLEAMMDDLHTPEALAALHHLADEANHGSKEAARALKRGGEFLGVLTATTEAWMNWRPLDVQVSEAEVERLIELRTQARGRKDFAEADRVRDELTELGVLIEDGPKGTTWRYAP